MSLHRHHDKDREMIDTSNNENNNNNNTLRRHSHAHLHLKPTVVFDHIKTKVKRKRNSSCTSREAPAFVTSNYLHGDVGHKESNEDENQFDVDRALAGRHSQPVISTRQSSNESYENHRSEVNHASIERDDNPPILIDSSINQEEQGHERVQWRLNTIDTEMNNSMKVSKTKSKLKLPKTQSEPNTKLSKHSIRSSGVQNFQIRDEDFNQIFPNIPSDEQLIVGYPCAWRKEIFMHGRMFLSVNYLCFYTSFFKWEESLCITYKDISSIKCVKSNQSLPNAIRVRTKGRDEYIFAGYIPRERIFNALHRLWQNALQEKPLDVTQLRNLVPTDSISLDESTGDSEESLSDEQLLTRNSNRVKTTAKAVGVSDTTYVSSCPCETHLGKMYAERIFSYHVDEIFDLIFGENSFSRAFHESQKLTDYVNGEWRRNSETGKRERQVTYKTVTQSLLGTNTISCTEKQTIETEKAHTMYVVSSEVFNEGMKYTDAFYVATRFCIWQRDVKQSSLRISAEVRYVKNVNGIAKAFIEKNCHSNLEDGINNQVRRLEKRQMLSSNSKDKSPPKKHSRKPTGDDFNFTESSTNASNNQTITSNAQTQSKSIIDLQSFSSLGIFIGLFLVILHVYLCYKLYAIDQDLNIPDSDCRMQCEEKCFPKTLHR